MDESSDKTRATIAAAITLPISFAVFFFLWRFLGDPIATQVRVMFTGLPFRPAIAPEALVPLLLISILIASVVYLSLGTRARAQRAAARLSRDFAESYEWFKKLYEYSPSPYFLVSPEGFIFDPNKATVRLFGMREEELGGRSFFEIIGQENPDAAEDMKIRFERGMQIRDVEVRLTQKTGAVRFVLVSIFANTTTPGAPAENGLVSLLDITERKAVDQAKTEFVSLASHQLLTPLSTTKWYTEALLGKHLGDLSEKQLAYVQKIHTASDHLIGLVKTLLNVSRLELGTIMIKPEPTNLPALTEEILDELTVLIRERGTVIQREYQTPNLTSRMDPKLMRIIVQNLVSNAIKYTPEGGTVTISYQKDAQLVYFTVKDTGFGIPESEKEHIFQKMYRASNVKRKNTTGTGLGLYIVRAVTQALGGSITFESQEDVGTTFYVKLPVVVEERTGEKRLVDSFMQ